jgi:dihydroflavonol-4-reductase
MALVTGANGFLGSRLVRHLVEQGEHVKAFVRAGANLDPLRDLPQDQVELAYGDVTVGHTVFRALARCDRMYHVAATHKFWDKKPERIVQTAVVGTEETIEAARRHGLRRIVVTSSLTTIGPSDKPEALTESDGSRLADPDSYFRSKIEAERIALARAESGLPVVVVCPGATFGPGDWKPTPSGRLVLEALRMKVLFYPDAGGLSVTDVDDVAAGHRLAMEKGRVGERYILAGDNLKHEEFFALIADLAGSDQRLKPAGKGITELAGRFMDVIAKIESREPVFSHRLARDAMFAYFWGSSEKAKEELGYACRPARKTLLRSLRWYLEHGYVPERRARDLALARA